MGKVIEKTKNLDHTVPVSPIRRLFISAALDKRVRGRENKSQARANQHGEEGSLVRRIPIAGK